MNKVIGVQRDGKINAVSTDQLAGDLFRLICVLTLALGIISNDPAEQAASIPLDENDIRDLLLMYDEHIDDPITAFSPDSIAVLQKLRKFSSNRRWIHWENVWKSYPFYRIDISPVLEIKETEGIDYVISRC